MSLTDRLQAAAEAAAGLGYHGTAGIVRDLADAVQDDGTGSHRELESAITAALATECESGS